MQYHPNQLLKNAVVSLPPQSTYTVSLLKGTSPPPTRRPFCQASGPSSNRTSLISFSLTSSLHCNLILPTLYAFRCRPMVVTLALFQLPTYSYLKLTLSNSDTPPKLLLMRLSHPNLFYYHHFFSLFFSRSHFPLLPSYRRRCYNKCSGRQLVDHSLTPVLSLAIRAHLVILSLVAHQILLLDLTKLLLSFLFFPFPSSHALPLLQSHCSALEAMLLSFECGWLQCSAETSDTTSIFSLLQLHKLLSFTLVLYPTLLS